MIQRRNWRIWLKPIGALPLLLLSGCTQHVSNLNDTLKEAFWGLDDVEVSTQTLNNLPYASTYVRINDGQRVFMVLAFAEKNPETGHTQLKWVSQDGAMLVTEQGRIVKTSRLFIDNLARRSDSAVNWQDKGHWSAVYDWSKGHQYGYSGQVQLHYLDKQTSSTPLWSKTLDHWQETITFSDFDTTMRNEYWVDSQGTVLKSIQYLGPEMARIEMNILKPFVDTQS